MSRIGIIGGSGLCEIKSLAITHNETVETPYGTPSSPIIFGKMCDEEIIFIPRHGSDHTIAPHCINYRANIWALKKFNVTHVIAVNVVGGISEAMSPLKLVFPHQIIDYTHSRQHTYYDESADKVAHIDFTQPYNEAMRVLFTNIAEKNDIEHESQAAYGAVQGPRLETAAEIQRLERDGCDIVGMTGMPEAALARELELEYVSCCAIVNWAAGKNDEQIISIKEIESNIKKGMASALDLLEQSLPQLTQL